MVGIDSVTVGQLCVIPEGDVGTAAAVVRTGDGRLRLADPDVQTRASVRVDCCAVGSMVDDGHGTGGLALLGAHFDELAELLRSVQNGTPDPGRVVQFAAGAVPHSEHCGLTLIRGSRPPATVASTGELTLHVDSLQYETNEGPCLQASEGSDVTRADDLAVDDQWPAFARRCVVETGVRSMFSVRLLLPGDDRAALNFYAYDPGAFDDLDIGTGAIFAPFAALALQNSQLTEENSHLQTALASSRQIGIAVGILMARQLLTAEQAFDRLVRASQHLNRKLRDIAADVERTGELPVRR